MAAIVEGHRFGERTTEQFLRDAQTAAEGIDENPRVLVRAMNKMADRLSGRRITIIAFVPEQAFDVPRTLSMQALHGHAQSTGLPLPQHMHRNVKTAEILTKLSNARNFKVVDVTKWACSSVDCPVVDALGRPLYVDDNHPSRAAAIAWREVFTTALQ